MRWVRDEDIVHSCASCNLLTSGQFGFYAKHYGCKCHKWSRRHDTCIFEDKNYNVVPYELRGVIEHVSETRCCEFWVRNANYKGVCIKND
jgi:hypothetical protein